MKKITIVTAISTLGLAAFALTACAQIGITAILAPTATTNTITVSASATAATAAARNELGVEIEAKLMTAANTEIANRITSLQNLETRVQGIKRISDSVKTSITASTEGEIHELSSLKEKINTDATSTLKDDVQSITKSYRVYAVVEPQMRILATSDRINTIANTLIAIQAKLQVRITALKAAGIDTTSLDTLMVDATAKISDAQAQGATTTSGTVNLGPDNGNATIAASNKTALLNARATIKAATEDLQAIRKDFLQIIIGIKKLTPKKVHVEATTTVSASTTTE